MSRASFIANRAKVQRNMRANELRKRAAAKRNRRTDRRSIDELMRDCKSEAVTNVTQNV
jgi:hypothetical protein